MNSGKYPLAVCAMALFGLTGPSGARSESGLRKATLTITRESEVHAASSPLQTLEFHFQPPLREASFLSGLRVTSLGNIEKISDFLFVFHGDIPSYYDAASFSGRRAITIETELLKLHDSLSASGQGLVVVQPLSKEKDWHSLFSSSSEDARGSAIVDEMLRIYDQVSHPFQGSKRLHLHSFSGAGRVDRAFHQQFLASNPAKPRWHEIAKKELSSWTVSDAMVNNSFSLEDKQSKRSVLAYSWAKFLTAYQEPEVTLIYDTSGEYVYMQGIILDVMCFYEDIANAGEIESESHVRIVKAGGGFQTELIDKDRVAGALKTREKGTPRVRLKARPGHLDTFLGEIADSYLERMAVHRVN